MKTKQSLSLALPIGGKLDQPTRAPELPKILDAVELVVKEAETKNKPEIAFQLVAQLDNIGALSGKAQAYTLFLMWRNLYAEDDDAFAEQMLHKTGKAADTLKKYLRAGEAIAYLRDNVPADIREKMLDRPVGDLIAVGQAMREHGAFSPQQLQAIARQPDNATLRQEISRAVGKPAQNSNILTIRVRRDGTLIAYQGENYEEIGVLKANTEVGLRAIARILSRSGITDDTLGPGPRRAGSSQLLKKEQENRKVVKRAQKKNG